MEQRDNAIWANPPPLWPPGQTVTWRNTIFKERDHGHLPSSGSGSRSPSLPQTDFSGTPQLQQRGSCNSGWFTVLAIRALEQRASRPGVCRKRLHSLESPSTLPHDAGQASVWTISRRAAESSSFWCIPWDPCPQETPFHSLPRARPPAVQTAIAKAVLSAHLSFKLPLPYPQPDLAPCWGHKERKQKPTLNKVTLMIINKDDGNSQHGLSAQSVPSTLQACLI